MPTDFFGFVLLPARDCVFLQTSAAGIRTRTVRATKLKSIEKRVKSTCVVHSDPCFFATPSPVSPPPAAAPPLSSSPFLRPQWRLSMCRRWSTTSTAPGTSPSSTPALPPPPAHGGRHPLSPPLPSPPPTHPADDRWPFLGDPLARAFPLVVSGGTDGARHSSSSDPICPFC